MARIRHDERFVDPLFVDFLSLERLLVGGNQ